ncbi:MAG: hypothetical protein ABIJ09_14690 [Pseudomonadota bacterium]
MGQGFALDFQVSKTLGLDPVVELDIGGGRAASWVLDEDATDREGLSYGFGYTASGSELEGTRLVTLGLVDVSGNVVANLSAGSLVLDFTPPTAMGTATVAIQGTSCPLDPRRVVGAGPGAQIAVSIVVSEELAGGLPADVLLASGVAQLARPLVRTADVSLGCWRLPRRRQPALRQLRQWLRGAADATRHALRDHPA